MQQLNTPELAAPNQENCGRARLQRLFFPDGVPFSGKTFDRTAVTSSLFEY
jgi:hypothetical protein